MWRDTVSEMVRDTFSGPTKIVGWSSSVYHSRLLHKIEDQHGFLIFVIIRPTEDNQRKC